MTKKSQPTVLVILDGWGISADSDNHGFNAIRAAKTPVWDRLWQNYPHTTIKTSGASVGLPAGQMGNSEVGHLNLGAGRAVYQEFTRVSRSIKTGSFFSNSTLTDAVDQVVAKDAAIHVLGLLSPGGVHSHEEHIHAMVQLAVQRGVKNVFVHAFLDGRDMPPKSARDSIIKMNAVFEELGAGQIASVIGRYYAMDRDHRWERVKQAYDLITQGKGQYQAPDALSALDMAYARGETDEFVLSTVILAAGEKSPHFIQDGDLVMNMNYRSDRAREITRPFIEPDFDGFDREVVRSQISYVTLTEYSKDFDVPVAYPPERIVNGFGEYISKLGLRQLRVAETEKYAHVTFFFNGGIEVPYEGEDRILVPSPKVSTYDLIPEMSAREVTDAMVDGIESGNYDVIICNYANGDMVGHTGNFEAAIQAIEVLDAALERIVAAVDKSGGSLLITADHGNVEQMQDLVTGQPHTAHTTNLVPLIYYGQRKGNLVESGSLCDIAPTMLQLMGLQQPSEMSGRALLEFV